MNIIVDFELIYFMNLLLTVVHVTFQIYEHTGLCPGVIIFLCKNLLCVVTDFNHRCLIENIVIFPVAVNIK